MNHQNSAIFLIIIKWPLALVCAAFLPAAGLYLIQQLHAWVGGTLYLWPVLLGIVSYMVIWHLLIRRTEISWFSTLEHEITHCLFAWLTFNRVVEIRATLRSGGHIRYFGTTNWLIQTAPYFFPTVTVVLLIALAIVDSQWNTLVHALVGASIAYHLISTWTETHHLQTDLHEAGFLFSLLFLPTANLLCYTFILAHMRIESPSTLQVFTDLMASPLSPIWVFWSLMTGQSGGSPTLGTQ